MLLLRLWMQGGQGLMNAIVRGGLLALALAAWFGLYKNLEAIAGWLVAQIPFAMEAHLAETIRYFLYDGPKVLMLLVLVIFVMGVIRSFFSPERTRALLAGRRTVTGSILAALLGIVTPFCSCSAVPMFIGFLGAGVPLGVTFSFLIAAPMVNEVALGLLFALAGWKVAALYLAFGLGVAIVSGLVLDRLKMEGKLEAWVRDLRTQPASYVEEKRDGAARVRAGLEAVRDIVGKVWPWILLGVAAGSALHGYAPEDFLARLMGPQAWWSVPLAVVVGVPLYSNAAGILPVATALLDKGAALGTVLAFMMSVTALSLPEMIILRKVMTVPLIAVFASVVSLGILCVGYAFNALF